MKSYALLLAKIGLTTLLLFTSLSTSAAPKSVLIPFWNGSDELNANRIDHSPWQKFLDTYVKSGSGDFNKVDYKKVSTNSKKSLQDYIEHLSNLPIRRYKKAEQFAYWVNLYNAATVQLILNNYPIQSITKLGEGLFSFGPWDDKILTVELQKLSLNDIEHGILRPIWKDKRIHYIVNCASISCPELSNKALTASNTQSLLQLAEKKYILSKRGFVINGEQVVLSKIYDWYQIDFAKSASQIIKSFKPFFPSEEDAERLDAWLALPESRKKIDYEYDWSLNSL